MEKRPKCALPSCENDALVLFAGKFICGTCLLKIQKKQQEKIWEDIKNGSS